MELEKILESFDSLNESIDKAAVKKEAISQAKQAFGDKLDMKKVDGMVDKAIELAKDGDTEDAVGILMGFFDEK